MNNGKLISKEEHKRRWPYLGNGIAEIWTKDGTYTNNADLHRTDGPAVVYMDNRCSWYINGYAYLFSEFCKELSLTNEEKTIMILKYSETRE